MKAILVLATGGEEDERRFAYADKIAQLFNADIDVILANALPPPSAISALPMSAAMPQPVVDPAERDAAIRAGDEIQQKIHERFKGWSRTVNCLRVDEFASGLGKVAAATARTYDTCICTLPGRERDLELSGTILDAVLVGAGHCAIGIPASLDGGFPIRNITIAWNSSRESARSVVEAMPLLKQAESVTVLLVDQLRRAGTEKRPGDDVLQYLTRHGAKAKIARVAKEELKTSEAILAEAKRQNADLLVIGAQAEGGILQWLRGSVSRDLLAKTSLPLLMAH